MRITGFALILITSLFNFNVFASTTHLLSPNLSMDYDFEPNNAQILYNFAFWTIKAKCTVTSEIPVTPVNITIRNKSASMDDITLSEGDTIQRNLQSGESFQITAAAAAKVEFLNLGEKTIKVHCST